MKPVKLHPAAAEEAEEAAAWYEAERVGLGAEFMQELKAAITLLREQPALGASHPLASKRLGAKRLLFKRFAFDLVFVERSDMTVVVAVAHQARRPLYWRARVRS